MLEGICINAFVSTVHHVVVEIGVSPCGDLESLVTAAGGDDRVGRRDGRNDVFHDTLCQRIGYSGDVELLRPSECFLIKPSDVLWIIRVK